MNIFDINVKIKTHSFPIKHIRHNMASKYKEAVTSLLRNEIQLFIRSIQIKVKSKLN